MELAKTKLTGWQLLHVAVAEPKEAFEERPVSRPATELCDLRNNCFHVWSLKV